MNIWDIISFLVDPEETVERLERRWEIECMRTEQLLAWSRARSDAIWDMILHHYAQRAMLDYLTEKEKELIDKRTESAIRILREAKRDL